MSRRPRTGIQGKVALAAIKGKKTPVQLAKHFDVHPNHIMQLKANERARGGRESAARQDRGS